MATSTIPAAIDGLITVLSASTALTGVLILDGPPGPNTPKDYVAVGYAEDGGSVQGQQAPAGLGNLRRSETYDISCQLSSWKGGKDLPSVRARAFELLAAVEDAIRAGATLNGAVIFADITTIAFDQYQTEQGPVATIDFAVTVQAARI